MRGAKSKRRLLPPLLVLLPEGCVKVNFSVEIS